MDIFNPNGGLKATGAAGACGFIRVLFVVFFGRGCTVDAGGACLRRKWLDEIVNLVAKMVISWDLES